jgi:YbbR domain-containing protein
MIDKTARNRWFMRAASVVFAFMLWYFVTWDSTGLEKRKYYVPLDYGNVPEGYSISQTLSDVEVELEGRTEAFAFLSIANIRASVEMSSWRPGKYSLPIQLTPPGGFRVAGYNPNIVNFEVFRTIERTFRPVLVLSGDVSDSLTLASVDVVPEEVTVKGPEAVVMMLRRAETRGEALEMTGGARELAVILTDENGEVSGLEIEPPVVSVTAHFSRALQEVRVPVKIEITGEPPEGLEVGDVTVSPDHVTLRGSKEALLGMTEIALNPIDVSGHTESVNIDIPLEAPSEAVAILGSPHVGVRVTLRDAVETRTYRGVPVILEGGVDAGTWSVSPRSVNITVERSVSEGVPFTPEKPPVELYIDATNVVASQITLPIMTRNASVGIRVIRIEPSQVTITALEK